jgi:CheY-like chemotaxis protein
MTTMLVVDDEPGIGDLLDWILTDEGHNVVVAGNGRRALERLADTKVDLIISDLMMPVMDGAGLLYALRQNRALNGVPFVLMCALPEDAVTHRITGYNAFLRKPFRIDDLLATIRDAFASSRR